MPSSLFFSTKTKLATKGLATALGSAFQTNKRTETGTYLGRNRILVGGQEYQFQNNGGTTFAEGDSLIVQNIGRLAAAVYAPSDLPGGIGAPNSGSTSSSASSSTTALADHTHSGAASSGGAALTAVTSSWNFLFLSATATVQAALDRLDSYGMFVKTTVQSGATLTIPAGYQQRLAGPYTVAGDIILAGDLVVL